MNDNISWEKVPDGVKKALKLREMMHKNEGKVKISFISGNDITLLVNNIGVLSIADDGYFIATDNTILFFSLKNIESFDHQHMVISVKDKSESIRATISISSD